MEFAQESAANAVAYLQQSGVRGCVVYQNEPPVPQRNTACTYYEFYVPFDNAFAQKAVKGENRVIIECQGAAPTGNWWYTSNHYNFFTKRQTGTANQYNPNVKIEVVLY